MFQDSTQSSMWDAVAADLRAYRNEQKQTWGELDHALIGRYLAGEINDAERSLVEAELASHPELRILTEVVAGVLADCAPVALSEDSPRILSFPGPCPARGNQPARRRQLGALAAAAVLLLGLGLSLNQPHGSSLDSGDGAGLPAEPVATGSAQHTSFFGNHDVVAMATTFVDQGELEKAATVLFEREFGAVPGRPGRARRGAGPFAPKDGRKVAAPPAPLAADSKPFRRTVARLANSTLDRMPENQRPAGFGGAGTQMFVKQDAANPPLLASSPPSRQPSWILHNSLPHLVAGYEQQDDKQLHRDCARALGRWIGVRDTAQVLSTPAREQLNARLVKLASEHHIAIVAETVRSLSPEDRKKFLAYKQDEKRREEVAKMAQRRSQEVGAEQALFLYICMDPPAVHVQGPALRRKRPQLWQTDAVQHRIQKCVENPKDLDRGLEDVVQMIERAIAK